MVPGTENMMPRYVLDTDTCIYWLKGDKNIEGKVLEAGLGNISITVITECELFMGLLSPVKWRRISS